MYQNKPKCMSHRSRVIDKLKWYSQVKHLGHTFNCCVNVSGDVAYRKGQFIGCVNSIITQIGFAHPVCKLIFLVTHGFRFYGSSLWDLYDNDSKMLYYLEHCSMQII